MTPASLLSVKEVASILQIRPETVRLEVKRNNLRAMRIGPKMGILRFNPSDITEYLEGRANLQTSGGSAK